jgi:hypothetical protein
MLDVRFQLAYRRRRTVFGNTLGDLRAKDCDREAGVAMRRPMSGTRFDLFWWSFLNLSDLSPPRHHLCPAVASLC